MWVCTVSVQNRYFFSTGQWIGVCRNLNVVKVRWFCRIWIRRIFAGSVTSLAFAEIQLLTEFVLKPFENQNCLSFFIVLLTVNTGLGADFCWLPHIASNSPRVAISLFPDPGTITHNTHEWSAQNWSMVYCIEIYLHCWHWHSNSFINETVPYFCMFIIKIPFPV